LAIQARPNALQQLFYYVKSLCVLIPFIGQLITRFKGICAGGVMAEAKWKYPDDDKHATVANADPGARPKLNNE